MKRRDLAIGTRVIFSGRQGTVVGRKRLLWMRLLVVKFDHADSKGVTVVALMASQLHPAYE